MLPHTEFQVLGIICGTVLSQVGARDQAIVKLQGCLKTAEEEQAQVENEVTL